MLVNNPLLMKKTAAAPTCATIPQDGLLSSYLLQGTAEDETGTYNATETGNTYLYDQNKGIVADFDGINDYIITPTISDSSVYSVSFWFITTNFTGNHSMFELIQIGTDLSACRVFTSGTTMYCSLNDGGGGFCSLDVTGLNDGLPHHVYAEWNNNGDIILRVDDTSSASSTATASMYTGKAVQLGTNYRVAGRTNWYDGQLSNVHLYNRSLTSAERTGIYNLENNTHNNPLDDGLIAYYPLDGNSLDNAVNQYDGTATGGITFPTDGDFGRDVAYFNGYNSAYINFMGTGLESHSVTDFSYSLWVKQKTESTVNSWLVQFRDGTLRDWMVINNSEKLASHNLSGDTVLALNTWYHAVVVRDSNGSTMYLNGAIEASSGLTDLTTDVNWCHIGTYNPVTTELEYDGYMTNFRVYDRALSETEVQWLYEFEKPDSTKCIGEQIPENGLTSYWPLDVDSDDYRASHDGSDTSISYISDGAGGKCADFNGSTSFVSVADSNDFSFGNGSSDFPFSVSFWVNLDALGSYQGLVGKDNGTLREWAITTTSANQIRFFLKHGGGGVQQGADSTTALGASTWYHVVCVYDGVGGDNARYGMTIYIDDAEETISGYQDTGDYVAMSNTSTPVTIGKYSSSYLNGQMSNVIVYDRALSSDEVTKLYNQGY